MEETTNPLSESIKAMEPFLAEFQQETDRAAAVLGAAYLESRLEVLLREKFVDVPKFVEQLFHGEGGLASFSAKISITYAIGLISKQAAEDLHIVRQIRNDFAHELHGLSFETPKIRDRVGNLRVLKGLRLEDAEVLWLDSLGVRHRFNFAVAMLLINAVEYRISQMPKFQEVVASPTIPLTKG